MAGSQEHPIASSGSLSANDGQIHPVDRAAMMSIDGEPMLYGTER